MNGFEQKLQQSLRRKEAPPGFADRVLDQVDETRPHGRKRRNLTGALSRIAAALLVGTIGTGAWIQYQESVRERLEAEQASMLVKLALHIASEKTNIAREHLTRSDSSEESTRKKGTNDEQKTN